MSYTAAPRLSLAPVANLRSISAHFVSFTGETPNVVATWGNNANDGVFFFFFVLHCCTCVAVGYRMCDTVTLPLSSTTTSCSIFIASAGSWKPAVGSNRLADSRIRQSGSISGTPPQKTNKKKKNFLVLYGATKYRSTEYKQSCCLPLRFAGCRNTEHRRKWPPRFVSS
ncbi:hypothetical protein M441DRAFT_211552 [Trichoderma asperellum CBS 433.97]|uniref:Uncharacterized protein n=1 Tax=Trichoderma asperellum (strain ATCC 204424 / CBS 433.97 / NBRC 101777) TaxID=1042311 RepID=A0A2T3ZN61_TRIA4|nr:hypothetical protein M441DRAFT_211552 [Trichoderma asperellum CBS 433.97]PTB46241.1 hypothetical protein M441DRAFT_211552 [Trichoderma asperellum CBS 433.97]